MRRGFTIVELLVASALAALLMVGVLRVAASIRLDPVKSSSQDAWLDRFVDLLRWDLSHARTISRKGGRFTLTGYGFLHQADEDQPDDADIASAHRPVSIEYFVAAEEDIGWLIRRQTNLDELTNQSISASLVCGNVVGFELEPDFTAQELASSIVDWGEIPAAMPSRVRLTLHWIEKDHQGRSVPRQIDRFIVLR